MAAKHGKALLLMLAAGLSPVQMIAQEPEPEPELQEGAGTDAVDETEDRSAAPSPEALVIVEGEDGAGSGFIATMRDRTFLVTNIHVLGASKGATFQTAGGKTVPVGPVAFLSRNRDLAIVPIAWDAEALEVAESLTDIGVAIGDGVIVMGNSLGAGVATQLDGEVTGIGPREIEVDAKFVEGNSGSPIVHEDSGKVVGIASHLREVDKDSKWSKDTELADIRRFGFRMDGEIKWQRVALPDLFEESARFNAFTDRTIVLAQLTLSMMEERTILTGYRDHDSLGYLLEKFDSHFNWARGTASASNSRKLADFTEGLRAELVRDSSVPDDLKIEFYRRQAAQYAEFREYVSGRLRGFEL